MASLSTWPVAGSTHAAVAVVGELVEAAVGHQHDRVAHRVAHRAEGPLGDPVGTRAPEPVASLSSGRGSPKRMTPGTPSAVRRSTSAASDSTVCWTTPGSEATGRGASMPVGHEQRCHQVVDRQPGLGHQPAQRRGAAQATQAADRGSPYGGRRSGHGSPDYGSRRRAATRSPGRPLRPAARGRPPRPPPGRRWCAGRLGRHGQPGRPRPGRGDRADRATTGGTPSGPSRSRVRSPWRTR